MVHRRIVNIRTGCVRNIVLKSAATKYFGAVKISGYVQPIILTKLLWPYIIIPPIEI